MEYEPKRRPLEGLSDEQLDALTHDLQLQQRELTRLYSTIQDERLKRYTEKLGR
jgi:hypothetical protein